MLYVVILSKRTFFSSFHNFHLNTYKRMVQNVWHVAYNASEYVYNMSEYLCQADVVSILYQKHRNHHSVEVVI